MYKFGYIDHLPTKPKVKMWFGFHLHETLKFILEDPYHLPTQTEAVRYYAEKFDKSVFNNDTILIQSYFENGLRIIESFYNQIKEKTPQVVTIEDKFVLPLGEHYVSGVFDRVDKVTDDNFEIIDYKTGKVPNQNDVDNNLQLTFYDWAARQKWPHLKDIKLTLHFLSPDVKLSTTRDESHHQIVKEKVYKTAEKIDKGKFEPTPGPLCNYCDFAEFCPIMKDKFRKEKGEIDTILNKFLKLKIKEAKIKNEIDSIKPHIHDYLDKEKVEQLFSDLGVLSRKISQIYEYDPNIIYEILKPKGKWLDVMKIDNSKLKKILAELNLESRELDKIKKAQKLVRERKDLRAKLKK